jgi:hypothetical protein
MSLTVSPIDRQSRSIFYIHWNVFALRIVSGSQLQSGKRCPLPSISMKMKVIISQLRYKLFFGKNPMLLGGSARPSLFQFPLPPSVIAVDRSYLPAMIVEQPPSRVAEVGCVSAFRIAGGKPSEPNRAV